MREPPCAALARERRQLESEESNAHADIVELKTIVAHLERLRLELTREQAFELRTWYVSPIFSQWSARS
jgi:hypothetical protein